VCCNTHAEKKVEVVVGVEGVVVVVVMVVVIINSGGGGD
jgi:hypothetical protein